jgi:predicted RNase H-like nuclease (RuvC/YqgF family)
MPTTTMPQRGLTFEDVWAALMKTEELQHKTEELHQKNEELHHKNEELHHKNEELHQKTEELHQKNEELQRKNEEAINKTTANVDKMAARVDKMSENVGGLNRSMGELIETLIAARLWEQFNAYPYKFKRAYRRVELFDETDRKLTDIDILLANGDYVMAVEVKRELDAKDDVDHHLKRMELILKYTPDQCKGKKLLGAIAGGNVDPDIQAYAHSVGFFVLELTGESVHLAKTPEEFNPRQW